MVAHELAHVEQLRRASGNATGKPSGQGHPAEVEAQRIAAAVGAGVRGVRAIATPGGAVAFDGPHAQTRASKDGIEAKLDELKGHLAALDSLVLTDEGRETTRQLVAAMIADIERSVSHYPLRNAR